MKRHKHTVQGFSALLAVLCLVGVVIAQEAGLWGWVMDAQTRQPLVADVSIVHLQPPHLQFFHARTDSTGFYEMQSLPPGEIILIARAEGFGFAWKRVTLEPEEALRRVVLALERAAVLEGQVVDEQGQPMAGVTVRLGYKDMPPVIFDYLTAHAETDAAGTYRIHNVTPNRDFHVEATHPHFGVHFSETSLRGQPAAALQAPPLRLQTGLTLEGSVLDAEGNPVPAAEIRLIATRLQVPSPAGVSLAGLAERLHRVAKTDAEGRFAFEGLEDGMWELVVGHPQFIGHHQKVEFDRDVSAARSVEIHLQARAE